jgi:hypothetical protein
MNACVESYCVTHHGCNCVSAVPLKTNATKNIKLKRIPCVKFPTDRQEFVHESE